MWSLLGSQFAGQEPTADSFQFENIFHCILILLLFYHLHFCTRICHSGDCDACPMSTNIVKFCPCGKNSIADLIPGGRTTCLDEIPTCKNRCEKSLHCGPSHDQHICKEFCHNGVCPPCPLNSKVRCRCGHMDCEVPCKDLSGRPDDVLCEKRCNKKRSCGRHKCGRKCCIEIDHTCTLVCGSL